MSDLAAALQMPRPTCSVEGCDREAQARGWCRLHWRRWRRHGDPHLVSFERGDGSPANFWTKVDKDGPIPTCAPELGPCWLWRGAILLSGRYGSAYVDGRIWRAHRWAWTEANGPIPAGHVLHHRCETPACVRPEHLEALRQGPHTGHHKCQLTAEQVRSIRIRYVKVKSKYDPRGNARVLAAEFGVTVDTVRRVARRRNYAWVTDE